MTPDRAAAAIALTLPRPIAPDYVPGLGSLTGLDVAASMAGLDRVTYCLLRLKYADDVPAMYELQGYLLDMMLDPATEWPESVPMQLSSVQIISEYYQGARCKPCDGTGINPATRTAPATLCQLCEGTGYASVSARARARAIGVAESVWRKMLYCRPLDALLDAMYSREAFGLRFMAGKLWGDERRSDTMVIHKNRG